MPEISELIQEKQGSWKIVLDEKIGIQLSWQEQPPSVVMSCALGQPCNDKCDQLYAFLLNANRLMNGVLDLRFALSPSDGFVTLVCKHELATGSLSGLKHHISQFITWAAGFSVLVSETLSEAWEMQHGESLPSFAHRV